MSRPSLMCLLMSYSVSNEIIVRTCKLASQNIYCGEVRNKKLQVETKRHVGLKLLLAFHEVCVLP